jgi:hypothetical protein
VACKGSRPCGRAASVVRKLPLAHGRSVALSRRQSALPTDPSTSSGLAVGSAKRPSAGRAKVKVDAPSLSSKILFPKNKATMSRLS